MPWRPFARDIGCLVFRCAYRGSRPAAAPALSTGYGCDDVGNGTQLVQSPENSLTFDAVFQTNQKKDSDPQPDKVLDDVLDDVDQIGQMKGVIRNTNVEQCHQHTKKHEEEERHDTDSQWPNRLPVALDFFLSGVPDLNELLANGAQARLWKSSIDPAL